MRFIVSHGPPIRLCHAQDYANRDNAAQLTLVTCKFVDTSNPPCIDPFIQRTHTPQLLVSTGKPRAFVCNSSSSSQLSYSIIYSKSLERRQGRGPGNTSAHIPT